MGIPLDAFVLISVGELNKNKNNRVIISALEKLQQKNIHYVLCGIGDQEAVLKEQVKAAGLQNNVHFLGYRTDVKELYEMADCFVMPSYREGLSRSIMEAMASGLPCIVSKIRGNVDLIEDGVGGYTCFLDDIEQWNRIITGLYKDKALCEQMIRHNKTKIIKCDVSIIKTKIETIYQNVMQEN